MKIPAHKGKFVLLIIYAIIVFLLPVYYITSFNPAKITKLVSSVVPDNEELLFENFITLLKDQKADQAYELLSPDAQKEITENDMRNLVKKFSTISSEMTAVGSYVQYSKGGESTRVTYTMSYEVLNKDPENKYMRINLIAQDQGQGTKINGVGFSYRSESIKDNPKFPPIDWKMFAAIFAPLFVVYTAYRYLTKTLNPRWWPFIGILFLSVYLSVVFNGDLISFKTSFGVYGFMGQTGSMWDPWVYLPFIPVGAIIYYFFQRKLENKN